MSKEFGIIAVYTYVVPHAEIPLIIVDDAIEWESLRKGHERSKGGIILTHQDIKDGQDVFALRFLHMQQHAKLISGKDVLSKIKIKKKHARHALESMYRVMLIDLREIIVQGILNHQIVERIGLSLSRMLAYSALVGEKGTGRGGHIQSCLDICYHEKLRIDDIVQIYETLEHVTQEVDTHT